MVNRFLSDMRGLYVDDRGKEDDLIYSYDNVIPADSATDLLYGITTLYPGDVNGEFYMTKGHKHVTESAEVYFGLEGEGVVLCENGDEVEEYDLYPGAFVYVKPGFAHRVINSGNSICRFVCVCSAIAGHNYDAKFSKRYYK